MNPGTPWYPDWPGFSGRGSLVLPMPMADLHLLPEAIEIERLSLSRKRELHVTLLDRELGMRLRSQEARSAVRPSLRELFEGEDWQWQPTGKRWLLREDAEGGPVHSIIELLDMPGLARFRHNVGWAHGQALPATPAHVTLYVSGNELGIGLASKEEFQRLRLRQL